MERVRKASNVTQMLKARLTLCEASRPALGAPSSFSHPPNSRLNTGILEPLIHQRSPEELSCLRNRQLWPGNGSKEMRL